MKYLLVLLVLLTGCVSKASVQEEVVPPEERHICYQKASLLYDFKDLLRVMPKEVIETIIKELAIQENIPDNILKETLNMLDYASQAEGTPQEVAETYYMQCLEGFTKETLWQTQPTDVITQNVILKIMR